jgi:hypothetical protein
VFSAARDAGPLNDTHAVLGDQSQAKPCQSADPIDNGRMAAKTDRA